MNLLSGCTLYVIFVLTDTGAADNEPRFLTDAFMDFINSNQTLWRAGRNFAQNIPATYIKSLTGTILENVTYDEDIFDDLPQSDTDDNVDLPKNFDARQHWPNCPSLNDIRDQGSCGSCWSTATVATLSDRICIASNGSQQFYFSTLDLLSCCNNCGMGCEGGLLQNGWAYCKTHGIVSGGKYKSYEGCQPYTIAPCDHRESDSLKPCGSYERTPNCRKICEKHYKIYYEADKRKCKKIYTIEKVKSALRQIYRKGPVSASFKVYEDFLCYKSGVYRYTSGDYLGGHSVKLIGWGVEAGIKYWLAANTWNSEWGDKGFFKIVRGENHCGIENNITAGEIY